MDWSVTFLPYHVRFEDNPQLTGQSALPNISAIDHHLNLRQLSSSPRRGLNGGNVGGSGLYLSIRLTR